MINSIKFKENINTNAYSLKKQTKKDNVSSNSIDANFKTTPTVQNVLAYNQINTTLSPSDTKKYTYLLNYIKDIPISPNAENLTCAMQLDLLLKNGKLLSKTKNDNSTTLDNLYDMATTKRACNFDAKNLISCTLDILCNPRVVTQTFGDIPEHEKKAILDYLPDDEPVKKDPSLMDVEASATCAAASNEVNFADKYPAEFTRWVSKLSSEEKAVSINLDLKSLSKNPLEAIDILKIFDAQQEEFSFKKVKLKISADKNAYIRAKIQEKYYDKGERNIVDVLIQSAIMHTGTQNNYDSLSDSPAGLIEVEKTYVESLIKNKEITSLVYQKIDDDQNLIGYNCSFEKMQKHILDTLNSGEDIIAGYVLTNQTSGRTSTPLYNPKTEGAPNKVINGHEIAIVDYKQDLNGNVTFICVDTDDDNPKFVEYSADWLLPKLHHAGYPAKIVEKDEKEIMKNVT